MSKIVTKTAKRSGVRKGHNKPNIPSMTVSEFNALLDAELDANAKAEVSKSHRYRAGLLLMLNDASVGPQWSRTWDDYRNDLPINDKTRKAKTDARKFIEDTFRCAPPIVTAASVPESEEQKQRRNNRFAMAADTMRFCVMIHRGKLEDAFTFNDTGATFIASASSLGDKLSKKWDADKAYKESGNERIQIVDRATTVPGRVAWSDVVRTLVNVPRAGNDNTGGAPERAAITSAKPVAAINTAVAMLKANPINASNLPDKRTALVSAQTIVAVALDANVSPEFKRVREMFAEAFREVFKLIGAPAVQAPTVSVPATAKTEIITPDNVVKLPKGKPLNNGNARKAS